MLPENVHSFASSTPPALTVTADPEVPTLPVNVVSKNTAVALGKTCVLRVRFVYLETYKKE